MCEKRVVCEKKNTVLLLNGCVDFLHPLFNSAHLLGKLTKRFG